VVPCTVRVASSLTIEAGTVVKFEHGACLDVLPAGSLTAIGSESTPIIFTSLADDLHGGDTGADGETLPMPGDWGCDGARGDLNLRGRGSVLEYVQDLYGTNGTDVQAESIVIEHSTFAHHRDYGLVLDGAFDVGGTRLYANAFFDNGGYPLHLGKAVSLGGWDIFHDPADPTIKNGKQCVELDADIDRPTILGVNELAFLFSGHKIESDLSLARGAILKSQEKAIFLEANGSISVGPKGSFEMVSSVTFTSYEDDARGGDCTGDGPVPPADGDWQGLWVDDGVNADYAAPAEYIRYAEQSGTTSLH